MADRQAPMAMAKSSASNLPFLQMCGMLEKFRIDGRRLEMPALESAQASNINIDDDSVALSYKVSEQIAVKHRQVIQPILDSLFPRAALSNTASDSILEPSKSVRFSSDYLKLLTYAATNNFAGVKTLVSLPMMYEYLQPMLSGLLRQQFQSRALVKAASLGDCTSAKPMAETFFRCAIEYGDVQAVRFLCCSREVAINANEQVCVVDGKSYTAIERAAALKHLALARYLVSTGVDVNKTFERPSDEPEDCIHDEYPSRWDFQPCGALEWALHQCQQPTSLVLDLVVIILQAGGSVSMRTFSHLLRPEFTELVRLLIDQRIRNCYRIWMKKGIFHLATSRMDRDTLQYLYQAMRSVGADFNLLCDERNHRTYRQALDSHRTVTVPSHCQTIIDIAAFRGNLILFQTLEQFGASLTVNTLTAAVRSENSELVEHMIASGAVADDFSPLYCSTPYAEAIRLQNTHIIRLLESRGCTERITEEFRFTALLAAASEIGNAQLVKYLLASPSVINNRPAIAGYALTRAVLGNQNELAETLLKAGAEFCDPNESCVFGQSMDVMSRASPGQAYDTMWPLQTAIMNRNAPLVRMLLDHGFSFLPGTGTAWTKAAEWGDRSVLDVLMRTASSYDHDRAVVTAIRKGDLSLLQYLLNAGVWPMYQALRESVKTNRLDMVQELLAYGLNPCDAEGLLLAMETSPTLFRVLLRAARERHPGRRDEYAQVLIRAIGSGRKDIVQYVLDDVSLDGSDDRLLAQSGHRKNRFIGKSRSSGFGRALDVDHVVRPKSSKSKTYSSVGITTPLLTAIISLQPDMVQLLIDLGANVNLPATLGITRTPLQQAAEMGSRAIVQLLLEHGAEINAPPSARNGSTALQLACHGGYIGLVEFLLENGADMTAPTSYVDGRTPLEGAAEGGRFDMVHYLLQFRLAQSPELQRARELAVKNGHAAVADILERELAKLNNPEPRVLCNVCGQHFSNTFSRKRHEDDVHRDHSSRDRYSCGQCPRTFTRKDNFERHKATHQKDQEKRMYAKCSLCGKTFRKDYLKQHAPKCQQRYGKTAQDDGELDVDVDMDMGD